ncbi:MAG TPA: ATP-binding cassette domain-containing protein, partial [Bacteroidota bacterium]|nr:ATP-binding cassette domain-containing protein [Bacteroidota bacterium]
MVAVQMQHITKRFGQVLANDDVELTITKGEIHALVGENGAGKSTLMHILYGIHQQDNGTITIGNNLVKINSPADAIRLGIGMVHQHFMLIPPLTVVENIMLGNEPTLFLHIIDRMKAKQSVKLLSESFHLAIDPDAKIESLSVGMQQRVEILKLLYRNAEILILDEPTPVLTPQEIDALFETLLHLKQQGKTVILITHKLNEVMSLADQVTVMRHGKVIASMPTKETNQEELAHMMVGREIIPLQASLTTSSLKIGLVLEHVSAL